MSSGPGLSGKGFVEIKKVLDWVLTGKQKQKGTLKKSGIHINFRRKCRDPTRSFEHDQRVPWRPRIGGLEPNENSSNSIFSYTNESIFSVEVVYNNPQSMDKSEIKN